MVLQVDLQSERAELVAECGSDQAVCLSRILFLLFPKSPTSEWGWSHSSWHMWWTLEEKILDTLDDTAAYEVRNSMLREMGNLSGAFHLHQKDLGRELAVEDPGLRCENMVVCKWMRSTVLLVYFFREDPRIALVCLIPTAKMTCERRDDPLY